MMAFGGFGKALGNFGSNIKKSMMGGGGVSAGPSGDFMSRFKQNLPGAINNAGQMWGGQLAPMARMTGQMMGRSQPSGNTGFNPGGGMPQPGGGIYTGPRGIPPVPLGGGNTGFTGGMFDQSKMGGNTGVTGGLDYMMNRPRLDPNTGQWTNPPQNNSGSIFSRIYNGIQPDFRPQIYT